MVAISPSKKSCQYWQTISFASTLYLQPVLDCILADIPERFREDLRLGLQEALVNAAKHGNDLDPAKIVLVQFTQAQREGWWVITDQGGGFVPPNFCPLALGQASPSTQQECGRGLYILYRIFDDVYWNGAGNELRLYKSLSY
ncbi:MAG: ATP-binding protein [Cyanobacteria bacterium P01_A01_bin.17]